MAEAGVIGKPDPTALAIVKAFVALNPGYEASDALKHELLAHAQRQRGIHFITYSNGKEWLDDDGAQNRALVVQWNGKPNPLPGDGHLRLDLAGNWIEAMPAGATPKVGDSARRMSC